MNNNNIDPSPDASLCATSVREAAFDAHINEGFMIKSHPVVVNWTEVKL